MGTKEIKTQYPKEIEVFIRAYIQEYREVGNSLVETNKAKNKANAKTYYTKLQYPTQAKIQQKINDMKDILSNKIGTVFECGWFENVTDFFTSAIFVSTSAYTGNMTYTEYSEAVLHRVDI